MDKAFNHEITYTYYSLYYKELHMSAGSIRELHYIAPIANLESIFDKGILSHNEAEPHKKADVSMDGVQKIRAQKDIPAEAMGQAKKIHDCTNLYFNAKNPMLSTRRSQKETICVLRLKPDLLKQPGAVIADRNAAVRGAQFFKAAEGVHKLAMNVLFGEYWTSKYNSTETNELNGHLRCAELLLPRKIHPSYIGGMYVASEAARRAVVELFPAEKFPEGCPVPITVRPAFFFDKVPDVTPVVLNNTLYPNPVAFVEVPPSPPKERVVVDLTNEEKPVEVAKIEAVQVEAIQVEVVKTESLPAAPKTYTSPKRGGLYNWLTQAKAQNAPATEAPKAEEIAARTITLPANITIVDGNLLHSTKQTLVNTVNCKGAMGKGIAEQFKKLFPAMFEDYKLRCDKESVKPGVPYVYKAADGKLILNFPTKDHWKNDSNLVWIQKGLDIIKKNYKEWGITSLALPPLGCGNGGLNWRTVRKMIIGTLGDIDIPIEIYQPRACEKI